MFRTGIIFNDGDIKGETFNTKDEAENYILAQAEIKEIKRADIKNLETQEREQIYWFALVDLIWYN